MSQLNNTVSLSHGGPTKLTNRGSITGPGTLLFTIPPRPRGGEFSAYFQAVGTLTGLASSLQADSSSGGAFSNPAQYAGLSSLLTAAAPTLIVPASGSNALVACLTYAVNVTALTGGPCVVWVTIN